MNFLQLSTWAGICAGIPEFVLKCQHFVLCSSSEREHLWNQFCSDVVCVVYHYHREREHPCPPSKVASAIRVVGANCVSGAAGTLTVSSSRSVLRAAGTPGDTIPPAGAWGRTAQGFPPGWQLPGYTGKG